MARKSLFESGSHASRTGYRGEITEADWQALRLAAPSCVPDEALAGLAHKIMFAEADATRANAHVPTRDQLTQLRKLKRIAKRGEVSVIDADGREHRFSELADALANLDQGSLDLIQAAERGAIHAVVDRDGVFVDGDGDEHRLLPPTIQVMRQSRSVWFPRGIEGFIESVAQVIAGLEMLVDDAGRRDKPWQAELAKTVVQFWQLHCTYESQSAYRDRLIADQGSPLVEFGQTVFAVAGSRLSVSRISRLLNTCK